MKLRNPKKTRIQTRNQNPGAQNQESKTMKNKKQTNQGIPKQGIQTKESKTKHLKPGIKKNRKSTPGTQKQ